MKTLFLPLLFFLANIIATQAQDTVYLDSKHKEVKKRKQAEYFKVVTKTDTGYLEEIFTSWDTIGSTGESKI